MRRASGLVLAVAVVGCALGATSGWAEGRDPALYVGTKTCGMCHKKAETGNQFGVWQAGPHVKAIEKLGSPEAKAAASKLGVDDPQKSGKCLKCHSTAYNGTETVQTRPSLWKTASPASRVMVPARSTSPRP